MNFTPIRIFTAVLFCLPFSLRAQTWVGGTAGSSTAFSTATNWSPASVPLSNADLVFNTTTNTNMVFNGLSYTLNSLTFASAATNAYYIGGNTAGSGITLNSGITTQAGSGGANFSNVVNMIFGANQTWNTASLVTVAGSTSGNFGLTKTGAGALVLSGANSYAGGTAVNAGGLYLGTTNSNVGTITVGGSGTLGAAYDDLTLGNAMSLASGATLGGKQNGAGATVKLTGAVSFADPAATINLAAQSDVHFYGTLAAANPTVLTFGGGGSSVAIMGATAQSNITRVNADNAAVVFVNAGSLPTTQIHATNGGYVGIGDTGLATPTYADLVSRITDKANFNGVIGFDTDDSVRTKPTTYDNFTIDLAGFTDGNVRLGSISSAVLGANTTIKPVGQSYDFGGYAGSQGLLVVKSNLTQQNNAPTGLSLVSPSTSGGPAQEGMVLALQGANTFTGNIAVAYSALLLDSVGALPTGSSINLGNYGYAGYTENAGFADFNAFASRVAVATGTSILGIDSGSVFADFLNGTTTGTVRVVNDATLDLSRFGSISLGSLSGATINSASITAPADGTLRFVNMGGDYNFTVNTVLSQSNGLVLGLPGSEGNVVLTQANTFAGTTALNGGGLLVGHNNALSSGSLTVVNATGDRVMLAAATDGITLANDITVTGHLTVGMGGLNAAGTTFSAGPNALTLGGVISGTGRLYLTGPTTLSGTNTYSGGTYVEAATTVTNNSALGTNFVDLGYGAVLTVDTPHLAMGPLSDAGNFVGGAGTGNIFFTPTAVDMTISQNSNLSFSGLFTGAAANLIKTGSGQLTLLGANGTSIASTTINGGSISIGDARSTTVGFGGNVNIAATGPGTGLFLRPAANGTIAYGGNLSGGGSVTINGTGTGTVSITGGASTLTGNTNISAGTLRITGDNFWSSTSATTVGFGAKLWLDGSQTIKDLSGAGTVNIATAAKTLTVNSTASTSFTGTISGSGGLTKTGTYTFLVSGPGTYTGATTISAGYMTINSASFASPTITVASGATLLGSSTLNDVIVNGAYSPGLFNAAGQGTVDSLTMGSTGLLAMQLGGLGQGTTYDFLNISNASGSGVFNAGGTLEVTFINAFAPVSGNTFNLFDFTSINGTFTAINLAPLTAGLSWDTTALYSTGELKVTGTAIPEPATSAAFIGLGMLALAMWRRRGIRAGKN